MTPAGAIPFADLRLGEVVWTCEHSNGVDHDPYAAFSAPPPLPAARMVTAPQTRRHGNVTLCYTPTDSDGVSLVTLHAPSRQFAFREKAACVAYYREAMATWARQARAAVDAAVLEADAYLTNYDAEQGE